MRDISILFLGASKRVSLMERFMKSATELGINITLFSCEKEEDFYPISELATILQGPSFTSPDFQDWLLQTIFQFEVNIIIPNIDSATVALSRFILYHGSKLRACWPVVSDFKLCETFNNKIKAKKFFNEYHLPSIINTQGKFPKIAKPIQGFGAKGIKILKNADELAFFTKEYDRNLFILEDFIDGKETTVDFYISPLKGLIGYVLRDRLEVSDGEVMVCETRTPQPLEKALIEKVTLISGWCGCITIQYIKDVDENYYLIEINPRFGGGATCSIEAGLNMPMYILSEYLDIEFGLPEKFRLVKMTRARRDFFCEL